MKLGFAVKVLGNGAMKETDNRRHQNNPHLRNSIEYLKALFEYLNQNHLRMYRISSELAPYLTHPEFPQFHGQLEECRDALCQLGEIARAYRLRLSFHPSQYIVLNAIDEKVAASAVRDLNWQARVLDEMQLGDEAVVVTHVGGAYGDKKASLERFAERCLQLPESTRRRLVLENDDVTFSVSDILYVHRLCGIRLIFDNLHHFVNNPDTMPVRDALEACLNTWQPGTRPKIHFSSPRTEARMVEVKSRKSGAMQEKSVPPDPKYHSDYINTPEFVLFMEQAKGLREFDVMLECKAKNAAALRLREDLKRYAPHIAYMVEEN